MVSRKETFRTRQKREMLDFDVDLTPSQFRSMARDTSEILLRFFADIKSRRVLPSKTSKEIQEVISESLPVRPQDPHRILSEVERKIIPNSTLNGSPRFFAFVNGSGTMMSVLADGIAAALNQNAGAWNIGPVATELEELVIRWFSEMIGYDKRTGGLLTSGGTMANVTALATALHERARYDIINEGLQSENRKGKFMLYMSDHEGHSSIVKAAQLLGLGRNSVKRVESNEDFTLNIRSLEESVNRDANEGNIPFCVVGQVGSVNVGIVDPLREIADVCRRHNLWFHADGACGAFGRIIPRKASLFDGLELADSVTLDPHKWLYISYECGCVLVKDPAKLKASFTLVAPYLRGILPTETTGIDYFEYGPEGSRAFRALKVWMSLKQYGLVRYRKLFERNVALAEYLDQLVRDSAEFEPLCKPVLQMYCFRFVANSGKRIDEEKLDGLNQRIVDEVQRSGKAFLMTTSIRGRTAIRLSITNHRTTKNDIRLTFEALQRTGVKLANASP